MKNETKQMKNAIENKLYSLLVEEGNSENWETRRIENFVICESNAKDNMPTIRMNFNPEDMTFAMSLGNPPGNAYTECDGEFFYELEYIDPSSLDYNDVNEDGEHDPDKWGSDSEKDREVSATHIDKSLKVWVDGIFDKCMRFVSE